MHLYVRKWLWKNRLISLNIICKVMIKVIANVTVMVNAMVKEIFKVIFIINIMVKKCFWDCRCNFLCFQKILFQKFEILLVVTFIVKEIVKVMINVMVNVMVKILQVKAMKNLRLWSNIIFQRNRIISIWSYWKNHIIII